jgi:hypothetical protein
MAVLLKPVACKSAAKPRAVLQTVPAVVALPAVAPKKVLKVVEQVVQP